jgi:hypothetical protein
MGKVYVVTAGVYSDYHILAVFSNRESAEKYKEKYEKNVREDARIEEYMLDSPEDEWIVTTVAMDKEGNVIDVVKSENTEPEKIGFQGFEHLYGGKEITYFQWGVVTDDEKRAIKVANEKRAIILANNLWGKEDEVKRLFSVKNL